MVEFDLKSSDVDVVMVKLPIAINTPAKLTASINPFFKYCDLEQVTLKSLHLMYGGQQSRELWFSYPKWSLFYINLVLNIEGHSAHDLSSTDLPCNWQILRTQCVLVLNTAAKFLVFLAHTTSIL